MEDLNAHPTVKPYALVADAIKDCTKRGDRILDGFAGAGTTILACERTKRIGYAIEIDPGYVDETIRRWEQLTGNKASHAMSGRTFDEEHEARASRPPIQVRKRVRQKPVLAQKEQGNAA